LKSEVEAKDVGGCAICSQGRTTDQLLNDAARFARLSKRFNHHPQLSARFSWLARDAVALARRSTADVEYFRMRSAAEEAAAASAAHARARNAHLEMASHYQTLISMSEGGASPEPGSVQY